MASSFEGGALAVAGLCCLCVYARQVVPTCVSIVLQVIAQPDERYESYCRGCDFIREHIFPGGHLPSMGAMVEATRGTQVRSAQGRERDQHRAGSRKTETVAHRAQAAASCSAWGRAGRRSSEGQQGEP